MSEKLEDKNLELWNRVKKTDPDYAKKVTYGRNYTAISPQYQAMVATREFGLYGEKWGLKNIEYDNSTFDLFGLVTLHAVFFYPNGEFEISNSIRPLVFNKKAGGELPDPEYCKKLETNTISKALSKLGFSADIFMGEFDDEEYFNELRNEKDLEKAENKEEEALRQKEEYTKEMKELAKLMEESVSKAMLEGLYRKAIRKATYKNDNNAIKRIEEIKNEVIERLNKKDSKND